MVVQAKGCYVDTSLIIARYKPADALHKTSKTLFEKSDLKLYISPITLIELYSILSRIIRELELPLVKGPLLDTLVAFIVEDCKLNIVTRTYVIDETIAGQTHKSTLEYHILMRFAEKLKLRTLDMLHYSYAWMVKKTLGVNNFVTGDDELLEKSEVTRGVLGIKTLHPRMI